MRLGEIEGLKSGRRWVSGSVGLWVFYFSISHYVDCFTFLNPLLLGLISIYLFLFRRIVPIVFILQLQPLILCGSRTPRQRRRFDVALHLSRSAVTLSPNIASSPRTCVGKLLLQISISVAKEDGYWVYN